MITGKTYDIVRIIRDNGIDIIRIIGSDEYQKTATMRQLTQQFGAFALLLSVSLSGCRTTGTSTEISPDTVGERTILVERLLEVSNDEILKEEANTVRRFLESDIKEASGWEIDPVLKPINAAVRRRAIDALTKDFSSQELRRLIDLYSDPVLRKYWATWPQYQVKLRGWREEYLDHHPDTRRKLWKLSFPNEEPPDCIFEKSKPNPTPEGIRQPTDGSPKPSM